MDVVTILSLDIPFLFHNSYLEYLKHVYVPILVVGYRPKVDALINLFNIVGFTSNINPKIILLLIIDRSR